MLTNHAVFSPIIAARALEGTGINFDIKIHGSAIVYVLKPHKRLHKYALPGFKAAKKIYTGTEYVKTEVLTVFAEHAEELKLKDKLFILSPGMNPSKFNISESLQESEKEFLKRVAAKIADDPTGRKDHKLEVGEDVEAINEKFIEDSKSYNQRVIDSDLPERWVPYAPEDRIILYIGAFINTKGMGELLAIAPSLIRERPERRFVFCGFGTYREHMSQLLNAFEEGDLEKAKRICKAGDFINKINIEDYFFKIDKKIKDRIIIAGFTDHHLLSQLLPLCSVCVVPSKIAEAFGMVTVESMAAGVLPICNNHSGLSDVLDLIEREFPELTKITRKNPEEFFQVLPQVIRDLLQFSEDYPDGKDKLRQRIRKISVDNFSWSSIGNKLAQ